MGQAMMFQLCMMTAALVRTQYAHRTALVDSKLFPIVERPAQENVIFAVANKRFGNNIAMDEYMSHVKDMISGSVTSESPHLTLLHIYLWVKDETAVKRMAARDRKVESDYDDAYMEMLADCYFWAVVEAMVDPNRVVGREVHVQPICVVDWNMHDKKLSDAISRISARVELEETLNKRKLVRLCSHLTQTSNAMRQDLDWYRTACSKSKRASRRVFRNRFFEQLSRGLPVELATTETAVSSRVYGGTLCVL